MSKKKTYILLHTDGSIEKTSVLDDDIYEAFDSGSLKIVDPKNSTFLNEDSEWEEIPVREIEEDNDEDDPLDDDDEI